jgi:hypothetical protein
MTMKPAMLMILFLLGGSVTGNNGGIVTGNRDCVLLTGVIDCTTAVTATGPNGQVVTRERQRLTTQNGATTIITGTGPKGPVNQRVRTLSR